MALPPLYKYLNVTGARLTLEHGTFRHAKPSDFNDLEDLTVGGVFPVDLETATRQITECFIDVLLAHINDKPTCNSASHRAVATILQRSLRADPSLAKRMKAEVAAGKLKDIYDIDQLRAVEQATIKDINAFMQDWRVLCVTTHRDSERMWSLYAGQHTGVALRVEAGPGRNSKFELFRPVTYREKRPPLYDDVLGYVASYLFGDQLTWRKASVNNIIHSKTLEWQDEAEYRLAIPLKAGEKPWDVLSYHPEEIIEINLGSDMTADDRAEILALAKARNPRIAVFQGKRDSEGKIVFEPA